MKTQLLLALALSISTIGSFTAQPAASQAKPTSPQLALKQGLTYAELFDIEENFVDAAVASMLYADASLEELLIDIRSVRVSSDGKYATVGWVYDGADSGTTLMHQQGDAILILSEADQAIPLTSIEAMGVPPSAAAEIAP